MSKLTITCREFKPFHRSTLQGFASIRIAELCLDVKDVTIHQKGESRGAAPPAKPMLDRSGATIRDATTGKVQYANVLECATREVFSRAVIAAVLEAFPNAFAEAEEVSS